FCDLPEPEKGFDQFAFTAHNHFGEALEPFAVRDFGAGFQPGREEFELRDRNLALLTRSHKCSSKALGTPRRRILGIRLAAVKPARELLANLKFLDRIGSFEYPF